MPALLPRPTAGAPGTVTGLVLMAPALILAALFMILPLAFIVNISFTEGTRSCRRTARYRTIANYAAMTARYLPNVLITIQLAALAMMVDLVFGVPFAYILVRKVRYRELVRAFMVFPMFGALYIAFGLRFLLLPGGPATPCPGARDPQRRRALRHTRRSSSRWRSSRSRSWS